MHTLDGQPENIMPPAYLSVFRGIKISIRVTGNKMFSNTIKTLKSKMSKKLLC